MALTLVKETGAGLSNANSYASAADGDSYHDAHLYATDWTGATTANKEKALCMATRLIDGCYQFNGFKNSDTQALQWPRKRCPDPDAVAISAEILNGNRGSFFDSDAVPAAVVNATCELARELIKSDTTDAVDGEGISQLSIANSIFMQFNKKDSQSPITPTAQQFLQKLGIYLARTSTVAKLIRT